MKWSHICVSEANDRVLGGRGQRQGRKNSLPRYRLPNGDRGRQPRSTSKCRRRLGGYGRERDAGANPKWPSGGDRRRAKTELHRIRRSSDRRGSRKKGIREKSRHSTRLA